MQTTRREIDSFVSRKSFKYNDVINSKIVNLDIWCHFRFLNELSQEFKSDIDSRLISDQVRMLKSSIQVESEDWTRVLKLNQKIDIKTRLDDQFNEKLYAIYIKWTKLSEKENHLSSIWWLHVVETMIMRLCIKFAFITSIQRVMLK